MTTKKNDTTKYDGRNNLIPQSSRTKEQQKEIARMGGIASGKARKEKKLLKDTLLLLLETDQGQEHICTALLKQAKKGNVKAFETIRDTVGQKPVEKTEVQATVRLEDLLKGE